MSRRSVDVDQKRSNGMRVDSHKYTANRLSHNRGAAKSILQLGGCLALMELGTSTVIRCMQEADETLSPCLKRHEGWNGAYPRLLLSRSHGDVLVGRSHPLGHVAPKVLCTPTKLLIHLVHNCVGVDQLANPSDVSCKDCWRSLLLCACSYDIANTHLAGGVGGTNTDTVPTVDWVLL